MLIWCKISDYQGVQLHACCASHKSKTASSRIEDHSALILPCFVHHGSMTLEMAKFVSWWCWWMILRLILNVGRDYRCLETGDYRTLETAKFASYWWWSSDLYWRLSWLKVLGPQKENHFRSAWTVLPRNGSHFHLCNCQPWNGETIDIYAVQYRKCDQKAWKHRAKE